VIALGVGRLECGDGAARIADLQQRDLRRLSIARRTCACSRWTSSAADSGGLAELDKLHDSSALTDEEYEAAKAKLQD